MDLGEEDEKGEVPFLSHIRGYMIWTCLITGEVNFDQPVKAAFARFFHQEAVLLFKMDFQLSERKRIVFELLFL